MESGWYFLLSQLSDKMHLDLLDSTFPSYRDSVGAQVRDGLAFLDSFRGRDKWKPAMVKLPPRGAGIRAI